MTSINDNERAAVQLAHEVRGRIGRWLSQRQVNSSVIVTPFVDSAGRPNLLIRANAYVAHALMLSIEEHSQPSPPPRQAGHHSPPPPPPHLRPPVPRDRP